MVSLGRYMDLFLILEPPARIPASTSRLPLFPQYHAKLGSHPAVRDISWGNVCVLLLPGRKRGKALASLCALQRAGRVLCTARVTTCYQAEQHSFLLSPSWPRDLLAPGLLSHFTFAAIKWTYPTLSALCVSWLRIYSGSSKMMNSPLVYEI